MFRGVKPETSANIGHLSAFKKQKYVPYLGPCDMHAQLELHFLYLVMEICVQQKLIKVKLNLQARGPLVENLTEMIPGATESKI